MATKAEDTLKPSDTSGSGLYGVDTATVKGDKASESLICDNDKEILRLSIQGFCFRRFGWENIVILRAGHRKVAIDLLDIEHNSPDRGQGPLLAIDLDHVVLVPQYIGSFYRDLGLTLREHEVGPPWLLNFKTMQDFFKFQEVFTGFCVQAHILNVDLRLGRLHQTGGPDTMLYRTAIQLWRKVPNQHDSLVRTHDRPRTESHLQKTGAKGGSPERGEFSTQLDTTTASNMGPESVNGSVMKRHASSLLVFDGPSRTSAFSREPFKRIPLDGRIFIATRCRCGKSKESCQHITLVEDRANTSSFLANRSSALGLTVMEPWVQASRLSEIDSSISQKLQWVELGFETMKDKMDFETAFDVLKHQHDPLFGAERHGSDHQSLGEPGSLTGYEPAAFDAGAEIFAFEPDVISIKEETMQPSLRQKSIAKYNGSYGSYGRSQDSTYYEGSKYYGRSQDPKYYGGSEDSGYDGRSQDPKYYGGSEDSGYHGRFQDPKSYGGSEDSGYYGRFHDSKYYGGSEDSGYHGRSKDGSKITSHLRFSTFESEPGASSTSESSECEEQGSTSVTQVTRKTRRASIETSAKQEEWRRRICRKIIVFKLWKREQDVCLPNELWSSPASFEFISVSEVSPFDKIKGLFETYSGLEWNWWPFDPTAKPLGSGKVRIRWQCACGDQRWTDASRYLARKCQALVNENTTAGHEHGNATSQSAGSAASHSQPGSVVPGSFPSDTSQSFENTSNICSEAQASHNQNTYKDSNSKDLYVLFCIYQQSQILHSQILATKCQNDEAFFENLRQEYRRLRGFFRFWFSPFQFSHCDFVKFTRFYVNELAKIGHSLPIDLIYQYNPRPPGPHEDPPISPHEFRRRFYTHLTNPCGRDEALVRIPKRQKRFQINLHVDGREDMWGLHVELRPCFLIVLMWQIIITTGGWAFMGWWLSRHQGDLQSAAMPVTLIVTAMMALWASIGKGMRETL